MMGLRVWLDKALKSTAFHEAGHTVAAALLQLPLLEGGMHIDMEGSGVTDYCHRLPGSLGQSNADQIEREIDSYRSLRRQICTKQVLPWVR